MIWNVLFMITQKARFKNGFSAIPRRLGKNFFFYDFTHEKRKSRKPNPEQAEPILTLKKE